MSLRSGTVFLLIVLGVAGSALAEETRSDDWGVSTPVPDGWRPGPKRSPAMAIALERSDVSAGLRVAIVVNVAEVGSMTEEQAFSQARAYAPNRGEIVQRPNGRFLRIDFTTDNGDKRIATRYYAAFRDRRAYYFVLTTASEDFERDARAIDEVALGATFFEPVIKKPPVAPPPTPPQVKPPEVKPTEPAPTPDAKLPGPKSVNPNALVRATPGEEPRFSVPKSDAAPITTPASPQGVRTAGKVNLLGAKSLVSHDGELDADGRLAQNLVDPAATKAWCSSPSSPAGQSKRFVFELPRSVDVFRVSFDAGIPEEAGFEGSGAREVLVQGSAASARGPWRELGRGTLEKGKNDQAVDLVPNEIRWLRVEILSNHGHPTLTQLMKVRAFASELVASDSGAPGGPKAPLTTDEGPFRLERLRLSKEKGGTALDPAEFSAGQTFWVYFKPRALRIDEKGECGLEVDLRLEDAQGNEKLSSPKVVDHHGPPPKPPLSIFASIKVELPADFPPGKYQVVLNVRDKAAGTELKEKVAFEVKKAP
ncbi:MAG TPA: hypothetical protein VFF73_31120 [Planctomycetota bacterium]|nr:hypothetical protein [Planctomycetota bacterium]